MKTENYKQSTLLLRSISLAQAAGLTLTRSDQEIERVEVYDMDVNGSVPILLKGHHNFIRVPVSSISILTTRKG